MFSTPCRRIRMSALLCLIASCFLPVLSAQTYPARKPVAEAICPSCPKDPVTIVSGDGQSGVVSTVLPSRLVVQVTSVTDGTPVANVPVSFALTVTPPNATGASLSGDPGFAPGMATEAITAADGTASAQLTLGNAIGQYQVAAGCNVFVCATATFTETAIGQTFTLLSGNQQNGTIGNLLANPLVVQTTNPDGTPGSGTAISFAITQQPTGATGATLSASAATTGVDGTASVQLTMGDMPGQYEVTASCSQSCTPGSVTFSETAEQHIIVIDPGHGQILQEGVLVFQRPPSPTYGLVEDILTLQMASQTYPELVQDGWIVYLTRSTSLAPFAPPNCGNPSGASLSTAPQCTIDLIKRRQYAENLEADVFVSVHTNASDSSPTAHGTEAWYRYQDNSSSDLAEELLSFVYPLTGTSRGVNQGQLAVLSDDMSSALIEVAFHTNSQLAPGQAITDEQQLNMPTFLTAASATMKNAIEAFITIVLNGQ